MHGSTVKLKPNFGIDFSTLHQRNCMQRGAVNKMSSFLVTGGSSGPS